MQKRRDRAGQMGDWLSRRPWCQTRLDPASRQTNRASLGIDDLAAAWVALTR